MSTRSSGTRSSGDEDRARALSLKQRANSSTCSRAMVTPAALRWPPNRLSRCAAARRCRRAGRSARWSGPIPCRHRPRGRSASSGRPNSSTMRDATIPMTPGCQPSSARTMPYVSSRSSCEHALPRLVQHRAVDVLAPRVQLLQLARDAVGLVLVGGQQQLDAAQRVAEPAHRVEPRREDEARRGPP